MGLTVTEKEHWKSRIARRIDKRIEALYAEEPNLDDRIGREARRKALESLGLAAMQAELDEIERQIEELEKRQTRTGRAMLAKVRGMPVEDVDEYRYDLEVDSVVRRRQSVFEEELLAESDRGRQILRLRQEKEDLTDVIWLSTSPRQLKDLWGKVNELLGTSPTQLEQEALAIPPVEEQ